MHIIELKYCLYTVAIIIGKPFFIFKFLQVAFGVDFTNIDSSDLSQPQKFTDLVLNTFSGVQESLTNPFFQVIIVP